MSISKDSVERLYKGAQGCAFYCGYRAEKKHCPCGIDYTIIKVQCDKAGRELRAQNCNESCVNYRKED